QQAVLLPGEVNGHLATLAEEGEQILVIGAAADGELLARGRLLEQFIKAVHRRRGLRGFDRDPLLDAGADVAPGGLLEARHRFVSAADVDQPARLVLDRMAARQPARLAQRPNRSAT